MIRFTWAALFSIVLCTITNNLAQAATYSLAFGVGTSIGQSTYQVDPSDPFDLDVYLVESGTPSDVNDNDGIWFTKILVTRGVTAATEPVYINSTMWSVHPEFDSTETAVSVPTGGSAEVNLVSEAPPGPEVVGGYIKLFTLKVTPGTVFGEITPFEVEIHSDVQEVFLWDEETTTFPAAAGATTIEVIPEPATAVLALAGLLLIRRRSRVCP